MEGQSLFEKILSVVNQGETVIFYCEFLPDWPVLYISDNISHYGCEPQQLYTGEVKYHALIHPDDLESLHESVDKAIAENKPNMAHTLRLTQPEQDDVWIDLRMTFERDETGNVTHFLGKFFNITEKVLAEERNRFLAQVIEQTADLVKVTDAEGYLVYVNQALLDKTGFSRDEMIGQKPSILKSDLQDRRKSKKLWKTITAGKIYKNLIRNRRKDGSMYCEEITISPVYNDANDIVYYVSTGKDLTEQVKAKESLNDMAMKDALTGIHNRRFLSEILCNEMDRCNRYGQRFSLLMFDIDHFKSINDEHGHVVGDNVLKEVSERIGQVVRTSDYFGRWGGEEFVIIGLEMDLNATLALAEKVREIVEETPFDTVGRVTASVGATVYYRSETENDILKRVDEALYLAKNNGRNRVEII